MKWGLVVGLATFFVCVSPGVWAQDESCAPRPCFQPVALEAEVETQGIGCLSLETREFSCSCSGGLVIENGCEASWEPFNFEINGCVRDGELSLDAGCRELEPGSRTTLELSRLDLGEELEGAEKVYRGFLGDREAVVVLRYNTRFEPGPEEESSCACGSINRSPARVHIFLLFLGMLLFFRKKFANRELFSRGRPSSYVEGARNRVFCPEEEA